MGAKNIIYLNPSEYFQGAVAGAVASLRVEVSDHAQSYLVHLLGRFINAESFYPTDTDGRQADTLAQQLAIALEEESPEMRARRLRELGDFSLYVAGFFTDSLRKKLVDVDYYIGMGGAAYENAARLEAVRARAKLLSELGRKFPHFVDILAQISEESGFNPDNNKDLLRTYDLWAKTGSDRLAKQLAKAGIVPPVRHEEDGEDS